MKPCAQMSNAELAAELERPYASNARNQELRAVICERLRRSARSTAAAARRSKQGRTIRVIEQMTVLAKKLPYEWAIAAMKAGGCPPEDLPTPAQYKAQR